MSHLWRHLKQGANQADIIAITTHLVTLICMFYEVDMKVVRICASLGFFFVWMQLLFWSRL